MDTFLTLLETCTGDVAVKSFWFNVRINGESYLIDYGHSKKIGKLPNDSKRKERVLRDQWKLAPPELTWAFYERMEWITKDKGIGDDTIQQLLEFFKELEERR